MNREKLLRELVEKLLAEECFNADNYNGDSQAMLEDALQVAREHFDGYLFVKGEIL